MTKIIPQNNIFKLKKKCSSNFDHFLYQSKENKPETKFNIIDSFDFYPLNTYYNIFTPFIIKKVLSIKL